jgi:hypothetical protein
MDAVTDDGVDGLLDVLHAPELTRDALVVEFLNQADTRSEGDDALAKRAVKYLEVIPCLPRLAPRCATRVALALQLHNWILEPALAAHFRDLEAVDC